MKPTANELRDRISPTKRLMLLVVGIVGIALLLMARSLEPDPRGYGTHEQLGLTPCYFQEWTGHVCPTCGCTTAWAYAVRGKLVEAISANVGGTLLCAVVVIGSPWLLLLAISGQWLVGRPTPRVLLAISSVWLVVAVCDWLRRVVLAL